LPGGGWVITWASYTGSQWDIHAQIFDAAGNAVGENFVVSGVTSGDQTAPDVTWLADGGFAIAWSDSYQNVGGSEVFTRAFDADGTPREVDVRVNVSLDGYQGVAGLFPWGSGYGVIFVTTTWNGTQYEGDVWGNAFQADGVPAVDFDGLINGLSGWTEYAASATFLEYGGYVVGYDARYVTEFDEIRGSFIRFFGDDGVPVAEYSVPGDQDAARSGIQVSALHNGGVAVVWTSDEADPDFDNGQEWDVYVTVLNDLGETVVPYFAANTVRDGTQWHPRVVGLVGGGFVVLYQDGETGVWYARIFEDDGSERVGEYRLPLDYGMGVVDLEVEALFDGNWVVTYSTYVSSDNAYDVFAQVFSPTGEAPGMLGAVCAEHLFGDEQGNLIDGQACNDTIEGLGGNDTLLGGTGNDSIDGGTGNDRLLGEDGNDTLLGGAGNDRLVGDAGDDSLSGGDDRDTILGSGGNDTLLGEGGDDVLRGGNDHDLMRGGAGFDLVIGGTGRDTIYGDAQNDTLRGNGGFDTVDGGAGDDLVAGGAQADLVLGGAGDDTLQAGGGFDTLDGGAGNDELTGNFNADRFVFTDGHGQDTITDFEATNNAEKIDLSAVSAIASLADLNLGSATTGAATQVGANVVIDTGGGNSITLAGVSLSDLDASDFIF
jgi:Ca2+-binding RTX toxin-like protein